VIQQWFAALWHELDDIALICITDRVGKEIEGKAGDGEERLRVRLGRYALEQRRGVWYGRQERRYEGSCH
jgi:hypothetical protein